MVALRTGDVRPQGIDLNYIAVESARDTFDRMGAWEEFDLAEFSSSEFISRLDRGNVPFVALPVFPSRVFRHSFVFINKRSGIQSPVDLKGKRVGIGLYTQTAAVWIRGFLQEDYGVDPASMRWVQGSVDKVGAHGSPSAPPMHRPAVVEDNASGRSLESLLDTGDIDALIGTRIPASFGKNDDIVRLFPDYQEVESRYFRERRIHPIMHIVAIRRERYERDPWIAQSLYDAFVQSRDLGLKNLSYQAAPQVMLPWLQPALQEMHDLFGPNPWPYGVEANRPTLEALVRHLHDQGLISRKIPLEEIFVPLAAGSPS